VTAYEKADQDYRIAHERFYAVLLSYRARKCSDAEFLAAKAEFAKATAAFEVAYAAEIQRLEAAGIDSDAPPSAPLWQASRTQERKAPMEFGA